MARTFGAARHYIRVAPIGGLQINDVSPFRADHRPSGGVKGSGAGREGARYAIEEMTELKRLVINLAGGALGWPLTAP
jgi:acyl-CoA reductase-like NAD-dependent aldehyde dehydrogenase